MNMSNKIQLIGHLGQDVEIVNFDNNQKLAKFRMATNDFYTTKDGEKKQLTQWHTVVAWDKMADRLAKLLSKGSLVVIQGKLVYREFEKDNVKHQRAEIKVSDFRLAK